MDYSAPFTVYFAMSLFNFKTLGEETLVDLGLESELEKEESAIGSREGMQVGWGCVKVSGRNPG